jgi:hypothetical protein
LRRGERRTLVWSTECCWPKAGCGRQMGYGQRLAVPGVNEVGVNEVGVNEVLARSRWRASSRWAVSQYDPGFGRHRVHLCFLFSRVDNQTLSHSVKLR